MAVPVYVDKTTPESGIGLTRAVKSPASTQPGQLILVFIKVTGNVTPTMPEDWVKIGQANSVIPTMTGAWFWKIATKAGVEEANISWGASVGVASAAMTATFSSFNNSNPFIASTLQGNSAASTSMLYGSVTPGQKETLGVLAGLTTSAVDEVTGEPPVGYTERQEDTVGPYLATGELAEGASGEKIVTLSAARKSITAHLALAPESKGEEEVIAEEELLSQLKRVPAAQPISLVAVAEGGRGRGFDLTDEVEGLQFSNVNPGGDEVCTFTLNREWFAENPEVGKGNLLRVIAGIDVLWQGRIEEIDRATGDAESLAVTAYGLGNRLSDVTFREIYIDRDLGKWGDASAQRRINVIASGATPERSLVVEQNSSGLQSLSMTVTGLIDDTEADAVYSAGGIKVGRLRVSEVTRLVFAADENLSATPRAWQTDAAGEETKGEDYKSATSIDFSPSTVAPFIVLNWRFTAATALERASTMLGFRYGGVRVFGTHGLTAIGTAPLDGFSADQIIGHILSKASGISSRHISVFSYTIPQFTVDVPTTPRDAVASVNAFADADYGTWGPDSPLDNSTIGYFDYTEKESSTQHWFATRSDFDSDLNFHTETQALFDAVDVSWVDEAGVSHVERFSVTSTDLLEAGLSPRVYPLDAGTTTKAGAQILAELFLNVFAGFAPARGSGSILGQIRHYRRGKLPAYYARADGSNIRIPDILPAETAFALDSTPDRRTIFPIKRVNVDLSGNAPKTTIEFDQTNDSLAMLLAQQATQAGLVG